MPDPDFLVRFWGARGSLPAPAALSVGFGSDTCCVEMRCGSDILIFDAGSGAASLGSRLVADKVSEFDLFFTHFHVDHIMGLPFLAPLYVPGVKARLYAGHLHLRDLDNCKQKVGGFMRPPYFPVTPEQFKATIDFRNFTPPATLSPRPGIRVSTARLRHPGGAVGYRVDFSGRSVCYVTDTEHVKGEPDAAVLDLIHGADIVIYDCTYTDAEFDQYLGFGHSTWEEGVRLCEAAGAKRLVLFHHQFTRGDEELKAIEAQAQARFPGAIAARTGLELRPDENAVALKSEPVARVPTPVPV
jgi:phosphoribosyl 1,2-cyclic phosphodiesterase